jgi:hypothetical protein
MALPFYNQGDQDIYAGGDHFIPQEQYRLNYTPSTMLASTIGNTGGVTGAQAANPYIWPPQGGGGGGGFSNTNKFGLNMDTMKTISQPKYVEQGGPANMYGGNYIKDSRQIAQDEHGNWKDIKTNQNPYHGNIQKFPSIIESGLELMGLKQTGDPFKDSWYGQDWNKEDEEAGFYSRATGPKNIIQRWKARKELKKQEKIAADKIAADKIAADRVGGDAPYGSTDTSGWDSPGYSTRGGFQKSSPGADVRGHHGAAQGGLIGYFDGGIAGLL